MQNAALTQHAITSPVIFFFLCTHISFLIFEYPLKLKGVSCIDETDASVEKLKIRVIINFGLNTHTIFLGEI